MKHIVFFLSILLLSGASFAGTKVHMKTNMGTIVIELENQKAPNTVKNFLSYVKSGFYNGTIFHRVIDNFMIQGGGYTKSMQKKSTRKPIKNEAQNGLKNLRGTLAMARTADPHSATAQFFINVKDNDFLDFTTPVGSGWGYAVFGKVIKGMDTVDKIKKVPTGQKGRDVPNKVVIIEKVWVKGK